MAEKKDKKVEDPPRKLKPKKAKHAAAHGGAWKVAYADFITTMMALFLLLWLLSASDQATKNIVAMYFKDPGIFDNAQGRNIMSGSGSSKKAQAVPIGEVTGPGKAGQGGSENRVTMDVVAQTLKRALHSTGPLRGSEQNVIYTPTVDGMTIHITDKKENPIFDPGRTTLTDTGEQLMNQIGLILALFNDFDLRVEGHSDRSPYPNRAFYTNWDLSLDRAEVASTALLAAGVPTARIQAVAGYADTRLLNPDDPLDSINRRISILIKRKDEEQIEQIRMAGPEPAPIAVPVEGEHSGTGAHDAAPAGGH